MTSAYSGSSTASTSYVIQYPKSTFAVDGFTYLTWGTNGMRDINMLRPITEEYIKPEVGTLIMFPSWLRHGVMPFFGKEDDERRTFSANINVKLKEKLTGDHYRKDRSGEQS